MDFSKVDWGLSLGDVELSWYRFEMESCAEKWRIEKVLPGLCSELGILRHKIEYAKYTKERTLKREQDFEEGKTLMQQNVANETYGISKEYAQKAVKLSRKLNMMKLEEAQGVLDKNLTKYHRLRHKVWVMGERLFPKGREFVFTIETGLENSRKELLQETFYYPSMRFCQRQIEYFLLEKFNMKLFNKCEVYYTGFGIYGVRGNRVIWYRQQIDAREMMCRKDQVSKHRKAVA